MDNKKKIGICVALICISFGAGYFSKPSKVITKTEIKEVVKVVEKTVTKEKKNTRTTIVDRKNPDGSSETTTVITDNGTIDTNTDRSSDSTKETSNQVITTNTIGLNVNALVITDSHNIFGTKQYRQFGVHVTKRVLGNFTAGVFATTDKNIGASVGIEF